MVSDDFLHPDDVVPASELPSALMEVGDFRIAQTFVEADTVVRQVFILGLHPGDGCIQVEDALCLQRILQRLVQYLSDAFPLLLTVHIDGGLHRPLIGGASVEDVRD